MSRTRLSTYTAPPTEVARTLDALRAHYEVPAAFPPEALAEAEAAAGATPAQARWAALDRKIAEEAPVVPLAYRRNSFLHGSGVAGFFVESYPAYPSYQVIGVSAS